MSTANCLNPTNFAALPSRDAVDGLAAIASAFDRGLLTAHKARGQKFIDVCAIALGWAMLVAVVLHPEVQIAAIGLGIASFALRSICRMVLGPSQQTRPIPADRPALQYG
ncbi:hypothetical protein JQ580_26565 [Bradyrhizobium japonicum]|uniref:hypothetical protein n=1 Tax=Bradyrhizobium japonicum TaxID=375 RepID=UPI001BA99472|nr:hypothetical protein [Bradyrhizobium japonicum]MBR0994290.1 hypothetical protein [Bradyrhizobium japonicum]